MFVRNVHQRVYGAENVDELERLLDTLATSEDKLWPRDQWPRMSFRGGKIEGEPGGHGPVRYVIETLEPRHVWFRFTGPPGFEGGHGFTITVSGGTAVLSHVLEMKAVGRALLTWPMVFRPLDDALIEDALDNADRFLGLPPQGGAWSAYVRVLRGLFQRRPGGAR